VTDEPGLHLGERVDGEHHRNGTAVHVDAADLTTHGVIVGMTGSGKTGLGVVLLEEVLLHGVPALVIDPKGDLGNLLLTFPDLSAESFAPWVEGADPAQVAATWKEGLAGWGIDGARIQQLRDAAEITIYTPGSTSGVPLDVVGGLTRPAADADLEAVADEVEGYVSGLLGLVGIAADPLASREHILLSNLVHAAWAAGQDLDLATLVGQVQRPPLRKLGVFELDEFFPPADRTQLAMRLNGLLASPSFAAWAEGEPLDIDRLLRPGGRPACAIVSLAHLSDEERQFVVTLLLSELVTWMRRQPGTDQLRALVYFDEAMGYVPPSAAPPAKAPILTILKQARAFGVGLVLATQNPVDLDYKALSNAGTWMIGRLQTEQDKARLLDGLSAAAGGVDTAAVSATIAGLAKREFVLRQAGEDQPTTFTTRWAMSYLRGPLTREQITRLMADRRALPVAAAAAAAAPAAPDGSPAAASAAVPAAAPAPDPIPAANDSSPVMPTVAEALPVRWLDPAASWAQRVDAVPASTTFAAALAARVDLLYDDTKADLRHAEAFECVLFPLTDPLDVSALVAVDHDPRDLQPEPPAGGTYRLPALDLSKAADVKAVQARLVDHLLVARTLTIQANPELKLYGRPGETPEAFALRCDEAADAGADRAAATMLKRYETRIERGRDAVAAARDRAEQAHAAKESRRSDEIMSGAGDLLGSLLGGRRSARSIAGKVGSIARRRGRANEAGHRVDAAVNRVEEKREALDELEADLADELAAIKADWDAKAAAIETLEVPLERTDVKVAELVLVWVPVDPV
jgi:hypothetical protein